MFQIPLFSLFRTIFVSTKNLCFTGESVQALLTIKNGGFYGANNISSETIVTSDMEAAQNENGENQQEDNFINDNPNDSRPGFLSALGLQPTGTNGASACRTPEKKSTQNLYNRRGTVSCSLVFVAVPVPYYVGQLAPY